MPERIINLCRLTKDDLDIEMHISRILELRDKIGRMIRSCPEVSNRGVDEREELTGSAKEELKSILQHLNDIRARQIDNERFGKYVIDICCQSEELVNSPMPDNAEELASHMKVVKDMANQLGDIDLSRFESRALSDAVSIGQGLAERPLTIPR
ncbi:MAG: hypothetical protein ACYC0V_01615 [Armatimonadota bacterium]